MLSVAGALMRWSAAYSSNDPEAVVKNYWPDAILLGTVSPVMSEGTEAIRTYFSPLKGSGNKNAIGERRTIVLDENAWWLLDSTSLPGCRTARPCQHHLASPCLSLSEATNGVSLIIIRHRMSSRRTECVSRRCEVTTRIPRNGPIALWPLRQMPPAGLARVAS